MNRKLVLLCMSVFLVAVLILTTLGCAGAAQPPKEQLVEIKIGHGEGHTGPAVGQLSMFKGREDAIEIFNEKWGKQKGIKIKSLWADTKYDVPTEVSIYKRFADQGIVCYNVAGTGTAEQLSVLAKEYKVPSINPANSKTSSNPDGWNFPIFPGYADGVAAYFQWVIKSEQWNKATKPKVAFISVDVPYGHLPADSIPYLKSLGIDVVSETYYPVGILDLTPQYSRAKELGADFIVGVFLQETKVAVATFKNLGLDKAGMKLMSPWLGWFDSTWPGAKKDAEGFLVGPYFYNNFDVEGQQPNLPKLDELRRFQVEKHGEVTQAQDIYFAGLLDTLVACNAVLKAADKVGAKNVNGQAMYDQLKNIDISSAELLNITQNLKATPPGVPRRMQNILYMVVADNGKWRAVTDWFEIVNLPAWKPSQ